MKGEAAMRSVRVDLASRGYDIVIGKGLLDAPAEHLRDVLHRDRVAIVADQTVAGLYLAPLEAGLRAAGIATDSITIPAGEASKNFSQLEQLCEALLDRGIERKDTLLALGGGVIGDLVGFAASMLRRGCPFVQLPTTLLAQVDSSVGGKTAINSRHGKNLIGAFYQPAKVLCDLDVLSSLPRRELLAGYAEVLKYGLLGDADFFAWLEGNGAAVLGGDGSARAYAVAHSCRMKADIVARDERETADVRALLNLGHTFGHALEADLGYDGRLLHGEAVAVGMLLAARLSAQRGLIDEGQVDRLAAHYQAVGLPASLAATSVRASGDRLVQYMLQDKKMSAGTLPFVLLKAIGAAYLDRTVPLEDVATFLDVERRRKPSSLS